MNATSFCEWMERMNYNILEAADALGLGRNTVARYRKEGAPKSIALACSAISHGLPPMGEE